MSAARRSPAPRYPRSARVNEILREVLAEELERLADTDPRLVLLTVTGVSTEPDLRHATVLFASLGEDAAAALADERVRLQAAVGRQVRLKRTPQLAFAEDPAVATGHRVEEILRSLHDGGAAGAAPPRAGSTDAGDPGGGAAGGASGA